MTKRIPPEVDTAVRRYAALLRQAIRAAGFTMRQVEERLGAGPKALQRIFRGDVDLKLRDVLAILQIIGLSEEEFFAIAARPEAERRPAASKLFAAFRRFGFAGENLQPLNEPEPSPEEFERMVEEAINRALERRARQGKPVPEAISSPDHEGPADVEP